jgi:hypothetical protein
LEAAGLSLVACLQTLVYSVGLNAFVGDADEEIKGMPIKFWMMQN